MREALAEVLREYDLRHNDEKPALRLQQELEAEQAPSSG